MLLIYNWITLFVWFYFHVQKTLDFRERLFGAANLSEPVLLWYFTNRKSQTDFFTQAWILCFTHSLSYKTHSWQYWKCDLWPGSVVRKSQTRSLSHLHESHWTFRRQWQQHQSLEYKQHTHNCFWAKWHFTPIISVF